MRVLDVVLMFAVAATTAHAAQLTPCLGPETPPSSAGGNSFSAALSADGRHVVFLSHANNLVTNDSMNSWTDLFMRDLVNNRTTLISVGASGAGGSSDHVTSPAISADGAWVAFASAANGLVAGDTNGRADIFLRDMSAGITHPVSSGTNPVPVGGIWGTPLISHDGRFVVYQDHAPSSNPGGMDHFQSIIIYDHLLLTNRLVNTPLTIPVPGLTANGSSHSAAMTPDGQRIVFVKSATYSLSNPPRVSGGEIFLRDMQSPTTSWVSTGVSNTLVIGGTYACYNPVISADGTVAVFKANNGTNSAGPASLYRRGQLAALGVEAELIATNASTQGWAQVSFDGCLIAYEAIDGIRIWDALASSNRLVMDNIAGTSGRTCSQPSISADGNVTAFLVASNGFTTLYRHDYASDLTTVAVTKPDGTPAIVSDSAGPLVSQDGRLIVFDSLDGTLVPGDGNRAYDVFTCSTTNGQIELVSARAAERSSTTPSIATFRFPNSISANGRFAAVLTADWTQADTNKRQDVYVRDLNSGAQTFLGGATNHTTQPAFSADGRYVAYLSVRLSAYAPWTGQQPADLFRRDLVTGETMLIHSNAVWDPAASTVAISPDGNRVAFVDRNSFPFGNGNANLYMRDVLTGAVSLISTQGLPPFSPQGNAGNGTSTEPRFSPDGRWLFFVSTASNLATNYIFSGGPYLYVRDLLNYRTMTVSSIRSPSTWGSCSVSASSRFVAIVDFFGSTFDPKINLFDLQTSASVRVQGSTNSQSTSISADGRWLAFDARPFTTSQIYVRDTAFQTNELISVQTGSTSPATVSSSHPKISHDGRYVIFASDATNLVTGDNNNAKDIFIRDRLRGVTMLASINRAGTGSGNGGSLLPVLAADGRTLLFQSFASDLIDGDFNETADVFVLRISGADSDTDGMDDDWEVAYFGDLTRAGSGDFDGDGSTDLNEHQLGTDPTNSGSVFQVLKLTREDGQGTKLMWSAAPGRAYRVQFKDDLSTAGWSDAPQIATAAGTTAVWIENDPAATSQRFYRVTLAQ